MSVFFLGVGEKERFCRIAECLDKEHHNDGNLGVSTVDANLIHYKVVRVRSAGWHHGKEFKHNTVSHFVDSASQPRDKQRKGIAKKRQPQPEIEFITDFYECGQEQHKRDGTGNEV